MAMATGRKGGAIADINVTPMADIMIVLLIIFMVVTPLLAPGPALQLPGARHAADRKDEPLVVSLQRNTTLLLGDEALAGRGELLVQLQVRLERLPAERRLVVVRADAGLPYAEVGKVLDLVREAGAEQVALATARIPVAP